MEKNIIMAGSGGQGVMLMGKLLSLATFESTNKNVTFFPSYGAEQRGGTANCYVVISDEMIGSPSTEKPDELIILNQPSMDKFARRLVSGGTLFINSSIVKNLPERSDITVVSVPATTLAIELGSQKVLNVIMLGFYIGYTDIIPEELMLSTILKALGKKESLISMNKAAFKKGIEIGRAACKTDKDVRVSYE